MIVENAHRQLTKPVIAVVTGLFLLIVGLVPASQAAASSESAACRDFPINGAADKFESALFAGAFAGRRGDQLTLLNPFERSLRHFSTSSESLVDLPLSARIRFDEFAPRSLWVSGDGHLVAESKGFYLRELDERMLPVPPDRNVPQEVGLARVVPFRWGMLGGLREEDAAAVVCGMVLERQLAEDQRDPANEWEHGLFYVPLGSEAAPFKMLADFEKGQDPRMLGCRLDGQVVAAVDGRVFVLLLSQPPQIYPVVVTSAGAELGPPLVLDPVPSAMRGRPPLPAGEIPLAAYPELMLDVEGSELPVELVGWEGALYLLLREPNRESGGTRWTLARIGLDGSVQQTTVDSAARHMTMIPGDENWVFVEKGKAEMPDRRNVQGLKFVPSDRVRSLAERLSLCR